MPVKSLKPETGKYKCLGRPVPASAPIQPISFQFVWTVTLRCGNHTKSKSSLCEQNARLLVLNHVVHIMTTMLDGVNKRNAMMLLKIGLTGLPRGAVRQDFNYACAFEVLNFMS